MPSKSLLPDKKEVGDWMISALRHSSRMEYYLHKMSLGHKDPQRPHDIVGENNKYEWDVIAGFAMQYRQPYVVVEKYLKSSLELHRMQYHHQMWNFPNGTATDEDMMVGALDAVCSLLEDRGYQGGTHSIDEIIGIAKKNPAHKTPWMLKLLAEVQKIPDPDDGLITDLGLFPNIGIPGEMYDKIVKSTHEAAARLRYEGRM